MLTGREGLSVCAFEIVVAFEEVLSQLLYAEGI